MKTLAVYGASGLGREVLELAKVINAKKPRWDNFIFIDDGNVPSVVNGHDVYKYNDAITKYEIPFLEIAVGIGEPATREKLFNKIKQNNISTPTLIHPDVYIPESSIVGQGVVIQYGCFISCNVVIKDYVYIQPQCNIGHDDILEEGCMISGFSNLGGAVHIGKWAYLGLSCAVKQLVAIGEYSIVGMGAVVHKNIVNEVIVMGNPARIVATNEAHCVFGFLGDAKK